MSNTFSHHIRRLGLLVVLLVGTLCAYGIEVDGATSAAGTRKVVRVGWYGSPFNTSNHKGRRSGYAYEYQLRIAAITGWEYEYVTGSWSSLYTMLERGEIDLLSDINLLPERESKMLFSEQPMGYEEFYLLGVMQDSIDPNGQYEYLNGKRICVNRNSYQVRLLKDWLAKNQLSAEVVEVQSVENYFTEKPDDQQYDAVCTNSVSSTIDQRLCMPIAPVGAADFYFGINRSRNDLKQELDKAMGQIFTQNNYYNRDLHEKYFARSSFFRYMPAADVMWIRNHGTIRIGYRDNYLPFCGTNPETGQVTGLLHDFIEKVQELYSNIGLTIEAVAYPTINQAIAAVQRGDIDVAFPNGMSLYDTEKSQLLPADAFIKSAEMAVVRSDDYFHTDGHVRAAINASNPNYLSLINEQYPNWELVNFPSTDECLKGVARGEADLLFISNYRMGVLNDQLERLGLKAVATGSIIPLCFATSYRNQDLYGIMSRLSYMMSESEIHASLARYSEVVRKATFMDFAKENSVSLFFFMLAFIALILFLLMRSVQEHRKAEAASQAKTRFLFNMSHDIRTPMNAVMGYAELIGKNLDDKERCRQYLDKMIGSGRFLLELINHVLEMARIESGKAELNEEPKVLGQIMAPLKTIFSEMAEQKQLKFLFSTEVHTKYVFCDQVKLNEVYLNLLSNAYKYTPAGGTIRVHSWEKPHEQEGWTTLCCTVEDTGVGMSKEFLPRLYDDFSREKTYTDNKIAGTGLGMAIVKRYVELMNGTIEVESQVGVGTKFTVTIPHRIALASDIRQDDLEHHHKATKSNRILMAEDNDINAEIAMEILQDLGFTVDRAADGVHCLDMLQEASADTYDLILMDIQMPLMNGYEATRRIRALADKEKAQIPVIAMTANVFEEDIKNAMEAGMNAHVGKPIEVDKLLKAIHEVTE
ncbi:MAG: transporter substrate-binding domain-containing protein [Bacteroidales bacterium]|nr:transporter substrate-binding domain-containing protein [Bacteroidales bacterium]